MLFDKKIIYFVLIIICFIGCKKEETLPPTSFNTSSLHNGILVLNEGLMNQNNSNLAWVNLNDNKVIPNVFLEKNNRLLGDTGNDMLAYGTKIYIAMTGSSTVEVIQKSNLKSIQQITFNYGGQPQQPRQIFGYNGKIYVTSFDGYVSSIDTTTLTITQRIKVGRNPEGLCAFNHILYVSNSGGLTPNDMDSTVYAIDLNTSHVIDTFWVGENPGDMAVDSYGNVYVVKRGNYSSNPSELVKINTSDGSVTNLHYNTTTLSIFNDDLYLSYYDYNSGSSVVSLYNCASQTMINPNFINNQEINTLYGVKHLSNHTIICIDAMNFTNSGYLRFFSSTGQLIKSINVGLNPNSFIYYE